MIAGNSEYTIVCNGRARVGDKLKLTNYRGDIFYGTFVGKIKEYRISSLMIGYMFIGFKFIDDITGQTVDFPLDFLRHATRKPR